METELIPPCEIFADLRSTLMVGAKLFPRESTASEGGFAKTHAPVNNMQDTRFPLPTGTKVMVLIDTGQRPFQFHTTYRKHSNQQKSVQQHT